AARIGFLRITPSTSRLRSAAGPVCGSRLPLASFAPLRKPFPPRRDSNQNGQWNHPTAPWCSNHCYNPHLEGRLASPPDPDERRYMNKRDSIYVAGQRGLAGSAIVRRLSAEGYHNLIVRTSAELDLRRQAATEQFFHDARPAYVFLAAARVGGIMANSRQ